MKNDIFKYLTKKLYGIMLLLIIVLLYVMVQYIFKLNVKENYESLTSCLKQGYPNDFCLRVPVQSCITNCPTDNFTIKKFNTFTHKLI